MTFFPLHFGQFLVCNSIGLNAIGNHIIYRAGFNFSATNIYRGYIDGLSLNILSTTFRIGSVYITGF